MIPGLGRSICGGNGNPRQYFCLENPCGQRSLVGYSPCGHKQSDMAERLTLRSLKSLQSIQQSDSPLSLVFVSALLLISCPIASLLSIFNLVPSNLYLFLF